MTRRSSGRLGRASAVRLVRQKAGILLDVSLGGEPQAGSVTFKDFGGSPLSLPWPLPDASVHTAVVTHVLEYLDPAQFFAWWDELHRVLRPESYALLSGPYGGDHSQGWLSDPAHRLRVVETTFAWLDYTTPIFPLHASVGRPQPAPWKMVMMARVPGTMGTTSYNVTMQAMKPEVLAKVRAL